MRTENAEFNAMAARALDEMYLKRWESLEVSGEKLEKAYDQDDLEKAKRIEYTMRTKQAELDKIAKAITHFTGGGK